jgi:hypothetical protein
MLSSSAIRERVFVEVERLRDVVRETLSPGASNIFTWLESELWVDRSRLLVLGRTFVAERLKCADSDRVPDNLEDELQFFSPRHAMNDAWQHVRLLKAFIRGSGRERTHFGLCGDFVNYAVVQPLVNPAFASLFWLALDRELNRDRGPSLDLGRGLGALAFDMASYPTSKSESSKVRDAQVQFVHEYLDTNLAEGKWRHASDEEWASYCAQLLHTNKAEYVFTKVANALQEP